MKNLQGLIAFVEAAAGGSLSAAAQKLEVTPAAVSKNLARLEAQLGVRLFNRSTRRIVLTSEGTGFLAKARDALGLLDEAVAEVSQGSRAPAGRVRLSVSMAFGRRWVLPLLPSLASAHPQLTVEVDLDNRPVDLVAEGFDIGIRGGVIEDRSLVARRICALPVVLVASPGYLRRHGVPTGVEDLTQHDAVAVRFANGKVSTWRFGSGRRAVELAPPARIFTSDPESTIDLALADAGIAQAGLHHALPYLRSGRLRLLMAGLHDPGPREVVLHYPHRQHLAPRVRVVVDALLTHFQGASDLHLGVAEAAAISAALPPIPPRQPPASRPSSAPPGSAAAPRRSAGTPAGRATMPPSRSHSPRR
jgi:DNA-binding transcriptional LysR family regulator